MVGREKTAASLRKGVSRCAGRPRTRKSSLREGGNLDSTTVTSYGTVLHHDRGKLQCRNGRRGKTETRIHRIIIGVVGGLDASDMGEIAKRRREYKAVVLTGRVERPGASLSGTQADRD
eukprot:1762738-Rhodomonas_salina.1